MEVRRPRVLAGAFLAFAVIGVASERCGAQEVSVVPDLHGVARGEDWTLFNREAEIRGDAVYLGARPGLGVAWFDALRVPDGVIEVTLQGRDAAQASFVGVAFRGLDEETFEAVYFRPFNFRASDALARSHAVQYVAHPTHTWQQLRADFPGMYEAALTPGPDPDSGFRARIEFSGRWVRVFVNGASEPCLEVPALGTGQAGRVGLWVGNNSDGLFSNFKVLVPEG